MSKIDLLLHLKKQLVSFLDELIESFPGESDFVIYRIFIENQIPTDKIMDYIVKNLCPLQEMVEKRDEAFFRDYDVLFGNFSPKGKEKVNRLKDIWLSGKLDNQDKEIIWQWFHTFIIMGNKYKNNFM